MDPSLPRQVEAGPATALLTWDGDRASRHEVSDYLRDRGIGFDSLAPLDSAFVCAGGPADLEALTRAPGATSVWGDELMTPALDRSVPTAFNGDPQDIWTAEGITGDGVGIAVLDTGIDATHPDLRYGERTKFNSIVLVSTYDVGGANEDPCPVKYWTGQEREDTEISSGHGTHIASVAAGDGTASDGRYTGMAPGADLTGINVVDTVTVDREVLEPNRISLMRVMAALQHIVSTGIEVPPGVSPVKVILMGWTNPGLYDHWHPLSSALRNLSEFSVVTVMPIGNEGPAASTCDQASTCTTNRFAVGPTVIGVGATPRSSRTKLADYSGRGDPTTRQYDDGFGPRPLLYGPMLVAPGSDVTAAKRLGLVGYADPPSDYPLGASGSRSRNRTVAGYQVLTGTSVAAAHVAGAIALMQQAAVEAKGCYLTSAQVRSVLRETASPMPGYAAWEAGAGAIDATAAVWGARFAPVVRSLNTWDCPPG